MPQHFKGVRVRHTLRVPYALMRDIREAAKKEDVSLTDWIVDVLTKAVEKEQ